MSFLLRARPAVVLLLAASCALAQTARGTSAATSQPSQHRDAVVLASLKGLVFVPDPKMIRRDGISASGVITQLDLLNKPSFRARMNKHLGHQLTLAGLDQVTSEVVQFCTRQHRPLVNVSVPEQNVDSGAIQILVTEFHVGQVRAQGNRWFSKSTLESDIRLKHGDAVDTQALLGDMDTVNDNSFRKVSLIYQPSSQPGYTDLVLQTEDRLPVRVYSGFDNSGTAATGHDRWNFGAVWGNVLGTDSQVSYQFSASSDLFTQPSHAAGEPGGWSFQGHTLSWTTPFHWGDSLMVFGEYERSVPNVGLGLGMLGLNGQASVRYIHNLPRTETFTESLQAGYDFKTTNNNLDFGGTTVSANAVEIDQFPVSYSAGLKDRWGATSLTAGLTYSPSGITANNNTAAFQPGLEQSGRALASARYIYFRGDFNRLTRLPKDLSYSLHVTGQSTNSNLLYTEQLAGGGPYILRGYAPFAILGDEGLLMSNELRAPAIRRLGEYSNLGELQFLTFWDYGSVHAYQPVAGDLNSVTASSAGIGVRYNLRSNIAAQFDYGWVLRSIPGTQAGSSMAAISLMVGN